MVLAAEAPVGLGDGLSVFSDSFAAPPLTVVFSEVVPALVFTVLLAAGAVFDPSLFEEVVFSGFIASVDATGFFIAPASAAAVFTGETPSVAFVTLLTLSAFAAVVFPAVVDIGLAATALVEAFGFAPETGFLALATLAHLSDSDHAISKT